jgi:hypothetical protein
VAEESKTANSGVQFRCCACNGEYPTQADSCPACGKRAFYNAHTTTIECTSRDGITIGLVDAMLSLARALNERLAAEAKRMKRSKIEWEWFSDEVQSALADLRHSQDMLNLFQPNDEVAMELIRRAAALIEKAEVSPV